MQLRLADFKFEQAQTLEEIQTLHAAFLETFNTTPHWAHQDREDERRTPVERARLHQLFGAVQFLRTVNRYGFVSVQRFYIYAEQGLSRQRVAIWIYEGEIRLEYQETLLARYRCAYDQRQRQLRDVSHPTVYPTAFASPQLELLELDETQWIKVQQRAAQHRTRRVSQLAEQLPLIHVGNMVLLWSYLLCEGVGKNCFPHVYTVM